MKNLAYLLFSFLLSVTILEGCEKTGVNTEITVPKLIATKTTLRVTDYDTLVVVGAEKQPVKWTISDNINDSIVKQEGNILIVKWYTAGKANVSASVNGGTPLTLAITITWYSPNYTTLSVNDQNIVITPHYYKSRTSDSTYFTLLAQFSKPFACNGSFVESSQSVANNNFVINLLDIKQPIGKDCTIPKEPLIPGALFYFYNNRATPFSFGTTYPLTINAGNKTYTGVVTLSPTYMDIVWNYDTEVTMSSKHITL
jgi:hypothetical protein